MFLPVVVYLFLSFVSATEQANVAAKCCEKNLQIQEVNSTLECKPNVNWRYQILAEAYNFLEYNSEGDCVDATDEEFFVFRVSDGKSISREETGKNPFPKCCPLELVYNPDTHSCIKNSNITQDFIKGIFVKIGLPNCKIIIDTKYDKLEDSNRIVEKKEKGTVCLDKSIDGGFVIRECQKDLEICKRKRCIKKCCPDGKSYVGGGFCKDTYVHGIQIESQHFSRDIENPADDYELIYGAGCPKVSLLMSNTISYKIDKNGVFKYYHNYSNSFIEEDFAHPKSYCIEHATKGKVAGYHIFNCYGSKNEKMDEKFSFTLWAKILSCIFLLVTIIVYIVLGEIRSTFGKILINYCMAMMILMIILIISHLSLSPTRVECKIRGYSLILFNSALFAWLNVMSLDIWWTFGTPKRTIGSDQRKKDLKKFVLYFLYGWGMPLCHMVLILILEQVRILPDALQPYVGEYYCFLENRNYARTVFILMPQLIFQIINTVLFLKTITYCIKVKNEINKMNDSRRNKENSTLSADKEKLGLIIKLAVIMGIVWIFEVISAFFEMKTYSSFTKVLEIVMDTITCLQGVFIFLIFICKRKTLNNIRKRMGLSERRISCSTSVITNSHHINNGNNGMFPMAKTRTNTSLNDCKM